MDYSRSEPPYYKITKANFPTRQQQVAFLKAYDKKLKEMGCLPDELGDYNERLREIQRYTQQRSLLDFNGPGKLWKSHHVLISLVCKGHQMWK